MAEPSSPSPLPEGEGGKAEALYERVRRAFPSLTNEQCVELVRKVVGIGEGVRDWRRGTSVRDRLPVGSPIATFMDREGRPSEFYDAHEGVGAPGNNTTHAAILAGYTKDGILVAEQYQGSGGPHLQEYKFNDPRGGEKAAENYYSINTAEGRPAGANNPLKEPPGSASQYGYGIGAAEAKPAPPPLPERLHAGMLARRATIGKGLGRHPSSRAFGVPRDEGGGGAGVGSVPVAGSDDYGSEPSSGGFAATFSPGEKGPAVVLKYSSRVVLRVA